MKYIEYADRQPRRLSFFLALEEFAARHLDEEEDYFFMWQVNPTVIFGRHQVTENEVNLDYCQANHIQFYRRKSGGGCVYADQGNVMLSYITTETNVEKTFDHYLFMVAEALRTLGIGTVRTQNNDLLIGNRKVSGNAIYHLPGKAIAHGTLLYDTDMAHMLHAITPATEKLTKHGIESVRQRITLLKDHTTLHLPAIKQHIRQHLCNGVYRLTDEDEQAVENIEQEYLEHDFIFGKHS